MSLLGIVGGAACEMRWFAAAAAGRPIGKIRAQGCRRAGQFSMAGLTPVERGMVIADVDAIGTPIVLVHNAGDRVLFSHLRVGLRSQGFGRIVSVEHQPATGDVRGDAAALAEAVDDLTRLTGFPRLHVISHGTGGVIARYYVPRLRGHQRVHTLATLGSPHSGTHTARFGRPRQSRDLLPGSQLFRELDQPAPECDTRFLVVRSDLDTTILPPRNGQLAHPDLDIRDVFVTNTGHLSLPINARIVRDISTGLPQLDERGRVVREAVRRITV